MDLLRIMTCGSVDDGKSTLIGRLLYETKKVYDDQLDTLARESKLYGTQGEKLDFALLVDGLQAEREQGITIDVAYRFFTTEKRRFIVADTPGHEQYTRNMVTAASNVDVALLLVDVRKGILDQTRRHCRIARLMGIRSIALVVNKMDLVDWSHAHFQRIESEFRLFAETLGIDNITAIPISALNGDNIVMRGATVASWYYGPTLLSWLETISIRQRGTRLNFAMPIQWVSRPNADFRGYAGRVLSGTIRTGEPIRVSPSGRESHVKRIVRGASDLSEASVGQSVMLVLTDEIDISRGDVVAAQQDPIAHSNQFEADIIWMNESQLLSGRTYLIQLHRKLASGQVTDIKHRVDINTGAHLAVKALAMNEIGQVNLSLDRPVPFAPYDVDPVLGAFIMIDRMTNATVGAGMIRHALRRADNIYTQALTVTKLARAAAKLQTPRCLWFTGLSGAGKSTLANLLEQRLAAEGKHTYILDGDNVRHGLNRDLGFTEADRVENVRRVAEVAKLMLDAGLIVIVSFISPFREDREMARTLFSEDEFFEIFVDAPIAICEARDVKGLYAKARLGILKNFTGIDSPYEPPLKPDVHIRTDMISPEQAVENLIALIR